MELLSRLILSMLVYLLILKPYMNKAMNSFTRIGSRYDCITHLRC